ncbi:hypothetical protein [Dyella sp. 2HG41-7]|uniref:hypothetical protein n=1 Tax=Dyella sp. 2HG41-7 TaxID=2883239 RepID=UPI001F245BB5|nr:hypothetical protein [Dyella sp. 2HG41-7]
MVSEILLRQVAKEIQANGKYSQLQNSWTIGVPNLQVIIDDLFVQESSELRLSYIEILGEGERLGFWVVDSDHDFVADLVVIRLLLGAN